MDGGEQVGPWGDRYGPMNRTSLMGFKTDIDRHVFKKKMILCSYDKIFKVKPYLTTFQLIFY